MRKVTCFMACAALFCSVTCASGEGNGDVRVVLTAKKVVKGANGKEKKVSAEIAKPGETIEYQAVYRNAGKGKVSNLLGTIPVPKGMEYLPGTARPGDVTASLDGITFRKIPVMKKTVLANGKEGEIEAAPSEYRYLRWKLDDLAPQGSVNVSARMKMSENE